VVLIPVLVIDAKHVDDGWIASDGSMFAAEFHDDLPSSRPSFLFA